MAECVIRCNPGLTHGFFVACLVKDSEDGEEEGTVEWEFGGETNRFAINT